MHLQLEEHRVEALFPTLLFSAKITDKKYLEDLKKRILQMTKDPSKGTKEGNVAWISHDNMQEMEEFQDLHDLLLRESVQIFKYYSIVCDSVCFCINFIHLFNSVRLDFRRLSTPDRQNRFC